ncbi:MAG: lysylphosphatidylglycerol synthase transmembrane domain-containing protein [Anaerolineales bacterium]
MARRLAIPGRGRSTSPALSPLPGLRRDTIGVGPSHRERGEGAELVVGRSAKPVGRIVGPVLRVGVSVGVMAVLLSKADLGRVGQTIAQVSLIWLGLALAVQLVGKVVWAMRWSATLAIFGFSAPLGVLVRGIFIGQFFNSFLPSSLGGDFYRGYWILDDSKFYRQSLFLVFLERFLGLIALGFVSFPALVLLIVRGGPAWDGNLLFMLCLLAGLCSSPIVLHPRVYGGIDRRLASIRVWRVAPLRRKVLEGIRLLHQAGWLRSRAFLLSCGVQLVGVGFYYCLGRGLGLPLSGWHYLVVVPLVAIATVLPVTINGIGVREGTLVMLTGALRVDMPASDSLALGLLASVMILLISLIGGGVFLAGKRRESRPD